MPAGARLMNSLPAQSYSPGTDFGTPYDETLLEGETVLVGRSRASSRSKHGFDLPIRRIVVPRIEAGPAAAEAVFAAGHQREVVREADLVVADEHVVRDVEADGEPRVAEDLQPAAERHRQR